MKFWGCWKSTFCWLDFLTIIIIITIIIFFFESVSSLMTKIIDS